MEYNTELTEDDRESIMDAMEAGELPHVPDVCALLNDAALADRLARVVDGITRSLYKQGLNLIDVSTDDDGDQLEILIVPVDD